jgi:hypothetical protein
LCGGGLVCCAQTGQCVNDQSDSKNCGGCGEEFDCGPANFSRCCGGVCTAFGAGEDPNNCGECGLRCGVDRNGQRQACQGSYCDCGNGAGCPVLSQQCCGGRCVEPAGDSKNCGACGKQCGQGESCCSGTCTNTQIDDKNCAVCGSRCGVGQHCQVGADGVPHCNET